MKLCTGRAGRLLHSPTRLPLQPCLARRRRHSNSVEVISFTVLVVFYSCFLRLFSRHNPTQPNPPMSTVAPVHAPAAPVPAQGIAEHRLLVGPVVAPVRTPLAPRAAVFRVGPNPLHEAKRICQFLRYKLHPKIIIIKPPRTPPFPFPACPTHTHRTCVTSRAIRAFSASARCEQEQEHRVGGAAFVQKPLETTDPLWQRLPLAVLGLQHADADSKM